MVSVGEPSQTILLMKLDALKGSFFWDFTKIIDRAENRQSEVFLKCWMKLDVDQPRWQGICETSGNPLSFFPKWGILFWFVLPTLFFPVRRGCGS